MKYESCQWINGGIEFRTDCIRTCCFGYLQGQSNEKYTVLIDNYKGGTIDWASFFEKKQQMKNLQQDNNPLPSCKNCIYLENKDWLDENYINHITLNHWTKCNCNCIYCYTSHYKAEANSYKEYNVLNILKQMKKQNILKGGDGSCMSFGGGEPTVLKDFDKLMNFLFDNNFQTIRINTSGIKYSRSIEKGLKIGTTSIVISPDSGTKATYEKIKQVKCFDKVWNNIKKYTKYQKNKNLVKVKYIIIPGLNDNKQEIDAWFDMIIKCNVNAIALSVEQNWYQKYYPNFPADIYEIIDYIMNKGKLLNLEMEAYCEAISVLRERQEGHG